MTNQTALEFFLALIKKLQIFLFRPDVQIQLTAIAIVVFGIGFIAVGLEYFIKKRFLAWPKKAEDDEEGAEFQAVSEDETESRRPLWQRLLIAARLLIFPVLGLIATQFAINYLTEQGQVIGLLNLLEQIFGAFLSYRLFLGILYFFFAESLVRYFHYRLFGPLFTLFVLYQIFSLFIDIRMLAGLVLTTLFETPLTLQAIFVATVGFYLWTAAVWGVNSIVHRILTTYTNVNVGRLEASLTLIGYVLIGVGLLVVLSSLGVDSTTFAAITGGLSVGLGFGLREVLSNLVSGMLLLFEGSIQPGDAIEVDGQIVLVEKLNVRATMVRAFDGSEMIVPNQKLFTTSVITFTGSDTLYKVRIPVRVSYDSDPQQVLSILKEIVANYKLILPNPKPRVVISNMAESNMEFQIMVWIDLKKVVGGRVKGEMYTQIWQEFIKHNIKIPFPKQDVQVSQANHLSLPEPSPSPDGTTKQAPENATVPNQETSSSPKSATEEKPAEEKPVKEKQAG